MTTMTSSAWNDDYNHDDDLGKSTVRDHDDDDNGVLCHDDDNNNIDEHDNSYEYS